MSDRMRTLNEIELADYYEKSHDESEFDERAAYPVEVRRNVTISVRFTGEEIDLLRSRAEVSGEKVTSYIRAAALQQASPLDRRRLLQALRRTSPRRSVSCAPERSGPNGVAAKRSDFAPDVLEWRPGRTAVRGASMQSRHTPTS